MVSFAGRQPSVAWEPVVIPDVPSCPVWVWFKPYAAPQDAVYQIPDDAFRAFGALITPRRLLAAVGIDAAQAYSWTVQGVTCEGQGGANPLLDQPLPFPGPAGIAFHMLVPVAGPVPILPMSAVPPATPLPVAQVQVAQAPVGPVSPAASGGSLNTLEAIDADWRSIIQIERQLDAVRRQLGGIQGTLQSLNRDLGSDERLYADNLDKKAWQDTRRWLREALAQVSKYIRAHDIGVTSSAGSRRRFEQVYREFVEPRRPFPGMDAEQLAFEQHRKTTQNLLVQMQSTYASAARDGVQRAQLVLNRIAAKVRSARAKR